MKLIIINGPNLNLLGKRETEIYGTQSFEEYYTALKAKYEGKVSIEYFQSNHEGVLIDKLQEVGFTYEGIILNAGALTHYSLALADTLAAISAPVLEVHISNIHAREQFREKTYTGMHAKGIITGLGLDGYRLAIDYFINL